MEHKDHKKPKDCGECAHFGIISVSTIFPSLCERNYLWFQCGGNFGYIKEKEDS